MPGRDTEIELRARELVRQAQLRGATDPPPTDEMHRVAAEKVAACQECHRRDSNQRAMLAVAVVAAVATISAAVLNVSTQHTAEKANREADGRFSATLEIRLAEYQRQLNRQSQAIEQLRDDLQTTAKDLKLRIDSSPMAIRREAR
jgi:hypothetical protein